MATSAQIEANRRNARKSTGPKTQEGKDKARMNAIVHGLRATVVSDENEGPLRQQLREQLDAEWRPGSITEHMVIDQIADTYVRLRRCPDVEAKMLGSKPIEKLANDFEAFWPSKILKLHQYESRLSRLLQKLIQQLRDLQRERFAKDAEEAEVGCVSDTPPHDTPSDMAENGASETHPTESETEIGQTNPISMEALNHKKFMERTGIAEASEALAKPRPTGFRARVGT